MFFLTNILNTLLLLLLTWLAEIGLLLWHVKSWCLQMDRLAAPFWVEGVHGHCVSLTGSQPFDTEIGSLGGVVHFKYLVAVRFSHLKQEGLGESAVETLLTVDIEWSRWDVCKRTVVNTVWTACRSSNITIIQVDVRGTNNQKKEN